MMLNKINSIKESQSSNFSNNRTKIESYTDTYGNGIKATTAYDFTTNKTNNNTESTNTSVFKNTVNNSIETMDTEITTIKNPQILAPDQQFMLFATEYYDCLKENGPVETFYEDTLNFYNTTINDFQKEYDKLTSAYNKFIICGVNDKSQKLLEPNAWSNLGIYHTPDTYRSFLVETNKSKNLEAQLSDAEMDAAVLEYTKIFNKLCVEATGYTYDDYLKVTAALESDLIYLKSAKYQVTQQLKQLPYEQLVYSDEFAKFWNNSENQLHENIDASTLAAYAKDLSGFNPEDYYKLNENYSENINLEVKEFIADMVDANLLEEYGISWYEYQTLTSDAKYLNSYQQKAYMFILKTKGISSADDFLSAYQNSINREKGRLEAEKVLNKFRNENGQINEEDVAKYLHDFALATGTGWMYGMENSVEGFENLFATEGMVSVNVYAQQFIVQGLNEYDGEWYNKVDSWGLSKAFTFGSALGNMTLPLVSTVLASYFCPPAASEIGKITFALSNAGNAKMSALVAGNDLGSSTVYAGLSGLSSYGLAKIFNLPGQDSAAQSLVTGVFKQGGRGFLQTYVDSGWRCAVLHEQIELTDVSKNAVKSATYGMLMSLVLSGGLGGSNKPINNDGKSLIISIKGKEGPRQFVIQNMEDAEQFYDFVENCDDSTFKDAVVNWNWASLEQLEAAGISSNQIEGVAVLGENGKAVGAFGAIPNDRIEATADSNNSTMPMDTEANLLPPGSAGYDDRGYPSTIGDTIFLNGNVETPSQNYVEISAYDNRGYPSSMETAPIAQIQSIADDKSHSLSLEASATEPEAVASGEKPQLTILGAPSQGIIEEDKQASNVDSVTDIMKIHKVDLSVAKRAQEIQTIGRVNYNIDIDTANAIRICKILYYNSDLRIDYVLRNICRIMDHNKKYDIVLSEAISLFDYENYYYDRPDDVGFIAYYARQYNVSIDSVINILKKVNFKFDKMISIIEIMQAGNVEKNDAFCINYIMKLNPSMSMEDAITYYKEIMAIDIASQAYTDDNYNTFEIDGKTYIGVDQHVVADVMEGKIDDEKLRSALIMQVCNQTGLDEPKAILFLQTMEGKPTNAQLRNRGICSYADVANAIFAWYEKNSSSEQFRSDFGFDMYYNGQWNGAQLLVDMWTTMNAQVLISSDNVVADTNEEYESLVNVVDDPEIYRLDVINKYLESHDFITDDNYQRDITQDFTSDLKPPRGNKYAEFRQKLISMEVNRALKKGEHVSIAGEGLPMYNINEDEYRELGGPHIMSVHAVYVDKAGSGYVVKLGVDSWGKPYYILMEGEDFDDIGFLRVNNEKAITALGLQLRKETK